MHTTILRCPTVQKQTGQPRSTLYRNIANGTFTKPVKLGDRAIGWPEAEVDALLRARIAGKNTQQMQALVNDLHAARGAL